MNNATDIEIIDREDCHDGFFRLERLRLRHRRFAGNWTAALTREVLVRGLAVAVLPYDPARDEVLLIEQFRCGAMVAGRPAWVIEVVAGIVDDGEPAERVAHRETMEEAGVAVADLDYIAEFLPSPGGSSEVVRLYCARIDADGAGGLHGLAHEGEDIRVLRMSSDAAIAMLDQGRIDTAITLIALQWLARHRDDLRRRWT